MIENFILNLLLKDTIANLGLMSTLEIEEFYKRLKCDHNRLRKNELGNFLRELQQNLSGQGSAEGEEEKLGIISQNNLNVSNAGELKPKIQKLKSEIVFYICEKPP